MRCRVLPCFFCWCWIICQPCIIIHAGFAFGASRKRHEAALVGHAPVCGARAGVVAGAGVPRMFVTLFGLSQHFTHRRVRTLRMDSNTGRSNRACIPYFLDLSPDSVVRSRSRSLCCTTLCCSVVVVFTCIVANVVQCPRCFLTTLSPYAAWCACVFASSPLT